VVEAHCRYRKPARYEDLLDVEVTVSEVRSASMRFDYAVRRDAELLAEGFTRHACIDGRGRPRRMPAELAALVQAR
jgi:acyl-CoA thioester hydrolase